MATLRNLTDLEYQTPEEIISYDYDGLLYRLKSRYAELLVTPNHRMLARFPRGKGGWQLYRMDWLATRGGWQLKKNAAWNCAHRETMTIPAVDYGVRGGHVTKPPMNLKMLDWLEFLGYYIAEGWTQYKKNTHNWIIGLSQYQTVHPDLHERMRLCASRLGLRPQVDDRSIRVNSKQLYMYLKPLGKSFQKYIPRELLDLDPNSLRVLFNALMAGDGRNCGNGVKVYTTVSKRLADDVQELALKIGFSADIKGSKFDDKSVVIRATGQTLRARHAVYRVNVHSLEKNEPNLRCAPRKITFEGYKGKVHCVKVKNGLIYVRYNGTAVWSGNSMPGCHFCSLTRGVLKARRVKFQEIPVTNEATFKQLVKVSGQTGAPVVCIGKKVVIGYDAKRLDRALGIRR